MLQIDGPDVMSGPFFCGKTTLSWGCSGSRVQAFAAANMNGDVLKYGIKVWWCCGHVNGFVDCEL
jgi:hypothetical protein